MIPTGRKHCGKRRNCSLRGISPFPTIFSKGLFPRVVKSWDCVVKKLNLLPNDKTLDWSKLNAFAEDKINVTEKIEICH